MAIVEVEFLKDRTARHEAFERACAYRVAESFKVDAHYLTGRTSTVTLSLSQDIDLIRAYTIDRPDPYTLDLCLNKTYIRSGT